MALPSYYDYFAVVESAIDPDVREKSFELLPTSNSKLDYLRFNAAMMEVNCRNRNRRWWGKDHMDIMMQAPHVVDYLKRAGGVPGENGHPIPMTGKLTMERLVTIDPNNMAFLLKKWWWKGNFIMGECETLDEGPGRPGNCMANNMRQGMNPAFSARTMVPQRRNADGSIDVTGPGRFVCFDRVNGPSCENAYIDLSVPVKNIITKKEFDVVMESFTDYIMSKSEACKRVIGDQIDLPEAAMEAQVTADGMVFAKVESGTRLFIPVERNLRRDIADFMRRY